MGIKSKYLNKYRGNSKKVLPPSNKHNFTLKEVEIIVKNNLNRLMGISEPKMPKGWI